MSFFGRSKMGIVQVPKDLPSPTLNLNGYQFQMDQAGQWVLVAATRPVPAMAPAAPAAPAASPAGSAAASQQVQQLQAMLAEAQRQNAALESTVANQQRTLSAQAGGSDSALQAAELNARLKDTELELARTRSQLDEQRFRNRVLLAMVTISEGDYIQLCDELSKDPRECNVAFGYIQRRYKEKSIPLSAQYAPQA